VLRATAFVVCLTLGVWLVLWLLLVRPQVNLVAAVPKASPVALHSLSGLLRSNADQDVATWREVSFDSLDAISSKLDDYFNRPVILYVTAPVASGSPKFNAEQDGTLDSAQGSTQVITGDAMDRFWRLCRDRHGETKLLLIIDPGRVGPDPAMGQSDHSSPNWLEVLAREGSPPIDPQKRREWDKKWRNFGILSACAPNQWSWPVEGQGRTIFDRVLNQSLAKPRKLQKTRRLVSFWVAQLVRKSFRGAVQNPIYLGDPDLDFLIRAEKPHSSTLEAEGRTQDQRNVWDLLQAEYDQRDAYEKRKPYRYDPEAWRDYQERLLQAERLYRAHRLDDAERELRSAWAAAKHLTAVKATIFGSLALGIRYASEPADYDRLERALLAALSEKQPSLKEAPAAKDTKAADEKKPAATADNANLAVPDAPEAGHDLFRDSNRLSASARNRWKDYVEGQLIEWMFAYQELEPVSRITNLFGEKRKRLFVKAIGLRIQAEHAAAAALSKKTSLRWAIDKGDQHLRTAQDLLFIDQVDAQELANAELDLAQTQYGWARDFVAAQDVVGQVQAELPFLGLWYVRHAARLQDAEVDDARKQIERIADRAHELDDKLKLVRSAAEGEDYFRAIAAYADGLEKQYQTLHHAFNSELKNAAKTSNWRLVDDVLLVPGIEARERAVLVKRVRDLPGASKDDQGETGATTADAGAPPHQEAAELGRAMVTRNFNWWFFEKANAAFSPSRPSPPAPDFEPAWIDDEKLEPETDKTYQPIASLAKALKNAVQRIGPGSAAAERISLDERLQDLMGWMATRMIGDADSDRAQAFLDAAGTGDGDIEGRIKPLKNKKRWLSRFAATTGGQPLVLEPIRLSIECQARQGVPEGRACLFVSVPVELDRSKVELFRDDLPIARGTEARLDSTQPQAVVLTVNRGPDDAPLPHAGGQARGASVGFKPMLFYRGQHFDGDTGVLTLNPIDDQFIVGIESDKEEIARIKNLNIKEVPRDQFTDRPNAVTGFTYPGCYHPSLLTILYKSKEGKSVEVDVELRYDDGREPKLQTLTLAPGQKNILDHYRISFENARPRDPKAPPAREKFLRQQKLVISAWQAGKRGKSKPLAQKTIKLFEVNPERFNTVRIWTAAPETEQSTRWVNVTVYRRPDDPVVAPVGVDVRSREGLDSLGEFQLRKGGRESTKVRKDKAGQARLVADEACTFRFRFDSSKHKNPTCRFNVIFAGDYTMQDQITVEGAGAPAAETAAPPRSRQSSGDPGATASESSEPSL